MSSEIFEEKRIVSKLFSERRIALIKIPEAYFSDESAPILQKLFSAIIVKEARLEFESNSTLLKAYHPEFESFEQKGYMIPIVHFSYEIKDDRVSIGLAYETGKTITID